MDRLIKVMVADKDPLGRKGLIDILQKDKQIEVVQELDKEEDLEVSIYQTKPDVVLLNLNLNGTSIIDTIERITTSFRQVGVVIITEEGGNEQVQRALLAGAKTFLVPPLSDATLNNTILKVVERQRIIVPELPKKREAEIITIISPKGGVGGTLISVNLAVSLADILKKEEKKVLLIDLDLPFGDTSILLNLNPTKTIAELSREIDQLGGLDSEIFDSYLIRHESGLYLLPSPLKPEQAELVSSGHMEEILKIVKDMFDYVVVDTPKFFHDTVLTAFSESTLIILLLSLELPAIKNGRLCLEILNSLHYRNKVKLVINRANTKMGIDIEEAKEVLNCEILGYIPSDGKVVVPSINEGMPFVLTNKTAPISKKIEELGYKILNRKEEVIKVSLLKKLFGG
ncbi:MAG: AAA family ATPase [bacterium]|nr:AAA family ATPase [bacterium]